MFFKYNAAAFVWALLIFILCMLPGRNLPDVSFWDFLYPDKLVHLFLYCVFAFLLANGFSRPFAFRQFKNHPFVIALMLGILYGALIEILQHHFVADRKGDLNDLYADAIGSVAGVFFCKYYLKRNWL